MACPPLSAVIAQIHMTTGGNSTGSLSIEGSMDRTNWVTIIAASTYTDFRVISSSTIAAFTAVRARILAHGSTELATVTIAAR